MKFTPQQIMDFISFEIDLSWVTRIGARVGLDITGDESGKWIVDLKSESPGIQKVEEIVDCECFLKLSSELLDKLFCREENPLLMHRRGLIYASSLVIAIKFQNLILAASIHRRTS